ncbi:hypothetical protein BJ170DRAFT_685765 [Xylariales sp. AK1849]|nr:hypothetical protein BJ170DRAFT_685765 [Xylariales sp. AK1849]
MGREGREKRKAAMAITNQAKSRHDKTRHLDKFARMQNADSRIWTTLNALKEPPKVKHKSYFEIADNTEKKKKLEYEITTDKRAPPGFEFVPTGNPELTEACKELSREHDAMIFIVSDSRDMTQLDHHLHRAGYHFRQTIVDRAREKLRAAGFYHPKTFTLPRGPEAIPQDRMEMFRQADAVLRDLFPRIPNTDRHEIVLHAFDKDNKTFNGRTKVGMAAELTLARRVQLAALAHIRHTKTRYDELLREGIAWENARKAVEQPCLDVIVKWRGDEETGRDQLDEILREVIEISDSEDGSEDESSGDEPIVVDHSASYPEVPSATARPQLTGQEPSRLDRPLTTQGHMRDASVITATPRQHKKQSRRERKAAKQAQQRFKRYAQVAETFNGDPHAPDTPLNDNRGHMTSHLDRTGSHHFIPTTAVSRGTVSNVTYLPHDAAPRDTMTHAGPSAFRDNLPRDRIRGQSPVLVRVGDSNAPKVGLPSGRQVHGQIPLSPVRHQFQDMLVESIEPQSPGVPRNREHTSSYFSRAPEQYAEIPRVISRTIVHQPLGHARPASPGFVSGADGLFSKRQRVTTQYPEHSEPFSETGFVRVVPAERGHGPRVSSYGYLPERQVGNSDAVSRAFEPRAPSSLVSMGESAIPSYGEVTYRTRTNPIVLGSPRRVDRIVETREPPVVADHGGMPLGRTEVIRDMPVREVRRVSDGPHVIYLDEPDPRFIRVRDYQVERHGLPPQQIGSFAPQESQSHRGAPAQPEYHNHPFNEPRRDLEHNSRPIAYHGNVVRNSPMVPHDVRYENTRGGLQPISGFPAQPALAQHQPEMLRHGETMPQNYIPANGAVQYGRRPDGGWR